MVSELVLTDIEELCYRWLVRHGIEFEFQSSLSGGYFELGGSVVDFLLRDRGIAIRCMGEYWHQRVTQQGRDTIQREQLEALGWTVVDIWGSDLKERLTETMEKALLGEEMLR